MTTNFLTDALGASITADGYQAGYPPTRLIDGNDGTDFRGPDTVIVGHYLTCDLGTARTITEVRFRQYGVAQNRATGYDIHYSDDGASWTLLVNHSVGAQDETFSVSATVARYWKITATSAGGAYRWYAYTLELRGSVAIPLPTFAGGEVYALLEYCDNYLYTEVQQWFTDHSILPDPTLIQFVAAMCYTALLVGNNTGTGNGLSLIQLEGALADTALEIEGVMAADIEALDGAIDTKFTNQAAAMGAALEVTEGNIVTAVDTWGNRITVTNTLDLQDVIDAVGEGGGLTQADLNAAVSTINNNTDADATSVNSHTTDVIGALTFATPTDVTNAAATVNNHTDAQIGAASTNIQANDDGNTTTVLNAIAAIPIGGGWPGLDLVTLGEAVPLVNGLTITEPMDGVLVNITTPPSHSGLYVIGGAYYDYKEGEVAFETDNGYLEMWQYLGFRQAIYVPKTMQQAAKVRFRVLAGAQGTVQTWVRSS